MLCKTEVLFLTHLVDFSNNALHVMYLMISSAWVISKNITLYNVCSVAWDIIKNVGGYLEYHGGVQYHRGCSVP